MGKACYESKPGTRKVICENTEPSCFRRRTTRHVRSGQAFLFSFSGFCGQYDSGQYQRAACNMHPQHRFAKQEQRRNAAKQRQGVVNERGVRRAYGSDGPRPEPVAEDGRAYAQIPYGGKGRGDQGDACAG